MRANPESFWTTIILIDKVDVSFKLDTGAEVKAISEETYQKVGQVTLQEPFKVLHGPARQTLDVLCQFTVTLEHHGNSSQQVIFIVRSLSIAELSQPL